MPKKVEEIVAALKKDGYKEDQAWAIAQAQYRRMQQKPKKGPAQKGKPS